ncbi:fumarate reductase (quinol) flavoprotein subunit [Alkalimonas mucilaginosa]|uniref:Fumarate reductase flavoprotein subunit n=1 Tax=Alkalimonas mucilaginosa TaxID=3057676 RepID=A0ABU7JCD1_9GAMM|nr:fumarate reductase (quinol) flavoprotein subunit [Alkalimonas sp. MEB004]MEE2023319.1 fumarate reductase (quinol) flavoprotein subunit [Alkalimonas sp. MEB004]
MPEIVKTLSTDVLVVGGGGAGLRSAIAASAANPKLSVTLLSKVYPMRSHTVAAEGGAAAVTLGHDSLQAHFDDTVAGSDWLAEQGVVDYFVKHAFEELVQLEHWGCPWSRQQSGEVQVRRFGGMKTERTWFAADKTGFHILHTLFQTSLKYPQINRLDEYFLLDLLVHEQRCYGVLAIEIASGELVQIKAASVILATGGAGRVYQFNTNGGIVTGDGMALAYRHGVALRDMEFVQYHPTGLPGSGILITEACRGEGGILLNKEGYRYLQDYGLGPETPLGKPQNKTMELGPRDKLSQAFWHEQQQGRTISHPQGEVVHLDLRHLGQRYLLERLPFICELAKAYVNVDPVKSPIPIRPAVHYTMGGILTDANCATSIAGLYAVGECASIGLHGANRLGSNSLTELLVFGKVAGREAARVASEPHPAATDALISKLTEQAVSPLKRLHSGNGTERWHELRQQLAESMEQGCGIYRCEAGLQQTLSTLGQLQHRYQQLRLGDTGKAFNTERLHALELGFGLDVAEAMCQAALERKESRGAHQRQEPGLTNRNDQDFLRHSLAFYQAGSGARIEWQTVDTSLSPPAERRYGGQPQTDKPPKESC